MNRVIITRDGTNYQANKIGTLLSNQKIKNSDKSALAKYTEFNEDASLHPQPIAAGKYKKCACLPPQRNMCAILECLRELNASPPSSGSVALV